MTRHGIALTVALLLLLTACSPGASTPAEPPAPSAPQPPAPPTATPPSPTHPVTPPTPATAPPSGERTYTCGSDPIKASPLPLPAYTPPAGWERLLPTPVGRDLRAVTAGGGLFAAVGDDGLILTSPDGERWQPATALQQGLFLHGIAWGGNPLSPSGVGRFVAVGTGGTVLTSPDGRAWSRLQLPSVGDLTDVVFSGGQFLALRSAGLLRSPDGERWFACTFAGPTFAHLTVADGLLIAFTPGGEKEQPTRQLFTSSDGLTWTARAALPANATNRPTALAGSGRLLAADAARQGLLSADGKTWEPLHLAYDYGGSHWGYHGGAFGHGRFLLHSSWCDPGGCGTDLIVSTDGAQWERIGDSDLPLKAAAFQGGRFVSVGAAGTIMTTDGRRVLWQSTVTPMPLTALAFGGGRFVALGPWGALLTSTDGRAWERPDGFRIAITSSPLLVYGGDRFVAAGHQKHTGTVAYTSNDGLTWRIAANFSMELAGDVIIERLAYHEGQFVVVLQDGRAMGSTDGASWRPVEASAAGPAPSPEPADLPGEQVITIARGHGRLVALTVRGELFGR